MSSVNSAATTPESVMEQPGSAGWPRITLVTPVFCSLPSDQWARPRQPRTVIDCWRVLSHLEKCEGVRYLCLGAGGRLA